mgnify:FL=1
MNMQWNNIIGHKQVITQLCLMQQEDRIPHAMLFCGTDGVGKFLVAEALAAAILCHAPVHNQACGHCKACRALAAGTHPDFFQIQPESETKAAPAIRIEAVRKLQEEIARIPLLSERRVVIMQEADKMNEAAANCLLKTIEEPSGQIVFILLTSRPSALLDTIISRCMRVEFGILQPEELVAILHQQGIEEPLAGKLASIADGSVSKALAMQDEELLNLQAQAFDLASAAGTLGVEQLLQLAKEMSNHSRERLIQWLGFLAMIYRDLLMLYSGSGLPLYNQSDIDRLSSLLNKYHQQELLQLLQLVQDYQKRLGSNVNTQLCLEGFLIRINNYLEE